VRLEIVLKLVKE